MSALGELFSNIAAAIREKNGETGTMKPAEFPEKIAGIDTVGVDAYYQRLAEALMLRDAEYLDGESDTMNMSSFVTSDGSVLASLSHYSFAGFTSVKYMKFTDTVIAMSNAFTGCSKLKILDFTVATAPWNALRIEHNALSGCEALEAIIVRDGGSGISQVTIYSDHGSNDTFYVYVPSADYDTIVSALPDNTISSDRFRKLEDYPDIDNWNA